MAALFLSIVFGIFQLFSDKKKEEKEKTIIILQQPVINGHKIVRADTLYPVKPKDKAAKQLYPKH